MMRHAGTHKRTADNSERYTPADTIELVHRAMGGIDLDPASCAVANQTVRASRYFDRDDDALTRRWEGRIYLNPPYGTGIMMRFVQYLLHQLLVGQVEQACLLCNNSTDTQWFHLAAPKAQRICFFKGRISFLDPDGSPMHGNPQGQAMLYYGKDVDQFTRVFGDVGLVLRS